MALITRYMFRQTFLATLIIGVVLTGVVWLAQSLKFIDLVARKGAPALMFLQMVFYLLPNLVIVVLPIAVFVAVVFVYDKLIADHEMIIMQSVGISFKRLMVPAILLGTLMTLILYIFTLYLLPVSFRQFRDIEYVLKKEVSLYFIQPGQFSSFGKYTFYIHERTLDDRLKGVLMFDGSNPDAPVTYTAEVGYVLEGEGGTKLILQNGTRQEVNHKTGQPSVLSYEQYAVETKELTGDKEDEERTLKPYERFVGDLLNPGEEDQTNHKQLYAAAHQRLVAPLYAVVFAVVGAIFLVLGRYNRRGRFKTIALATVCVAILQVLLTVLLNATQYAHLAIPLVYGSLFLVLVCAYGFLVKAERGH